MGKIFGFIFTPLGWLIRTFYSWTHNYLISILLFALVIEIILSPLQIKQQKNSIKQAKLAPKINAIRKRYAGRNDNVSKQKMNQEIMEVYQQEGFNPAGGCLPMLIQLPIVLCVYQVIINPLTYLSGLPNSAIETIKTVFKGWTEIPIVNALNGQVTDPSKLFSTLSLRSEAIQKVGADTIGKATLPDFKMFGLDLAQAPRENFWPLIIIPILVFLTTWGSVWIMKKFTYQAPEAEEAQNRLSIKIMNLAMPLFSAWISYMWVAVLGIYWAFRSVLSV
ncbi:MAG: YidC/Oxa1 family membrane protein insertase, partial [Clostridia bacterium]|nr:YidC/Oxa1 family membrane protein insertase [Clostridia bacterium]